MRGRIWGIEMVELRVLEPVVEERLRRSDDEAVDEAVCHLLKWYGWVVLLFTTFVVLEVLTRLAHAFFP